MEIILRETPTAFGTPAVQAAVRSGAEAYGEAGRQPAPRHQYQDRIHGATDDGQVGGDRCLAKPDCNRACTSRRRSAVERRESRTLGNPRRFDGRHEFSKPPECRYGLDEL